MDPSSSSEPGLNKLPLPDLHGAMCARLRKSYERCIAHRPTGGLCKVVGKGREALGCPPAAPSELISPPAPEATDDSQ